MAHDSRRLTESYAEHWQQPYEPDPTAYVKGVREPTPNAAILNHHLLLSREKSKASKSQIPFYGTCVLLGAGFASSLMAVGALAVILLTLLYAAPMLMYSSGGGRTGTILRHDWRFFLFTGLAFGLTCLLPVQEVPALIGISEGAWHGLAMLLISVMLVALSVEIFRAGRVARKFDKYLDECARVCAYAAYPTESFQFNEQAYKPAVTVGTELFAGRAVQDEYNPTWADYDAMVEEYRLPFWGSLDATLPPSVRRMQDIVSETPEALRTMLVGDPNRQLRGVSDRLGVCWISQVEEDGGKLHNVGLPFNDSYSIHDYASDLRALPDNQELQALQRIYTGLPYVDSPRSPDEPVQPEPTSLPHQIAMSIHRGDVDTVMWKEKIGMIITRLENREYEDGPIWNQAWQAGDQLTPRQALAYARQVRMYVDHVGQAVLDSRKANRGLGEDEVHGEYVALREAWIGRLDTVIGRLETECADELEQERGASATWLNRFTTAAPHHRSTHMAAGVQGAGGDDEGLDKTGGLQPESGPQPPPAASTSTTTTSSHSPASDGTGGGGLRLGPRDQGDS